MKRGATNTFLAVVTLLVLSSLHFTDSTIHAATISQGQPGSPAAAQSEAIQSQIKDLQDQIKQLEQQLNQAKREKQQLQQELQALNKEKPIPPAVGSMTDKAAYEKALSDWQARVNDLKMKIDTADKKIKALEAQLKPLKQKLQNLQKALPPARQRRG